MNELIKDFNELPEWAQEWVRKELESRVLNPALIYKESCVTESEYLNYLDEQIELANKSIKKLLVEASNDKIERYWEQISKLYVFFTEGKKELINLKDECLRQKQANGDKEPQQKEFLKNDRVLKILQKAIDAKLISKKDNGFVWNSTKQLLAYFAEKMSKSFSLSSKMDKDSNITTNWKIFEMIFNVKNLKSAKHNWMRLNIRFEPTGFEKVDALF